MTEGGLLVVEVTDEVRRAVYAADCAAYGHQFDFTQVVSGTERPNPNDPRGLPMPVLRARDTTQLPHITCMRCGLVWLVIDEPGHSYDEAVRNVALRCRPVDPGDTSALRPRPVPGTLDRPIPMAEGHDWEALPAEHPSVMWEHQQQQERRHAEQAADLGLFPSGEPLPPLVDGADPDTEPLERGGDA